MHKLTNDRMRWGLGAVLVGVVLTGVVLARAWDDNRAVRGLPDKPPRVLRPEQHLRILAVALSPNGALLATAEGSERFAAIPVAARSTIGAGDSMLAGIVVSLSRGLALNQAVRFGMAAGAAALLGSGTALCRVADVERLYAQMSQTQSVCGSFG